VFVLHVILKYILLSEHHMQYYTSENRIASVHELNLLYILNGFFTSSACKWAAMTIRSRDMQLMILRIFHR
jgi:hypothetical protein